MRVTMPLGGKLDTPLEHPAGDDRACVVDCTAMLRQHELLVSVEATGSAGLQCSARPLRGARELEVRIWGGTLEDRQPSAMGRVALAVKTTQGRLSIELPVRTRAAT